MKIFRLFALSGIIALAIRQALLSATTQKACSLPPFSAIHRRANQPLSISKVLCFSPLASSTLPTPSGSPPLLLMRQHPASKSLYPLSSPATASSLYSLLCQKNYWQNNIHHLTFTTQKATPATFTRHWGFIFKIF